MRTYTCTCGNTLYFENTQCLQCGKMLGFLPDLLLLSPLEFVDENRWQALMPEGNTQRYRQCDNYSTNHVCNWMIAENDSHNLCVACRLNLIIPDLSKSKNCGRWYRMEQAKRRLLYSLLSLKLPLISKQEDPRRGLAFRFMEDVESQDFYTNEITTYETILTGHKTGVITINLAEANPSAREEMREKMNERYRTLLGHFRHESGHYFWERLIAEKDRLENFRLLFGDEREDYQSSLKRYYANGPQADWQGNYISAYASSHPWEDWAESWAHYLHITDTLETAHDYGFHVSSDRKMRVFQEAFRVEDLCKTDIRFLINDWRYLATALNAMNRSMGLQDPYPFALSSRVIDKFSFVHQVVVESRLD